VYTSWALMSIANRTRTKDSWLAWIPIGNLYLWTQVANIEGWWTVVFLLIPITVVYAYWQAAKRLRRPTYEAIFLIIPVLNFIFLGIWAWD
jgi:hypothetical protein